MSEVTVKAMQPVLGLADGTIVTIERTPRVDNAITAGRLLLLEDHPDPKPTEQPATEQPADKQPADEAPRTKRVRKLAGD